VPEDCVPGHVYALGSDQYVYSLRLEDRQVRILTSPELAEFQTMYPEVIPFDRNVHWGYYENYPTPLPEGIMATSWANHSFIDQTGRMDTRTNADNRYGEVHPLSKCTWTLFPNKDTPSRGAGPELKVTTPDGIEFWPDDLAYYYGENSWADLDDDEW